MGVVVIVVIVIRYTALQFCPVVLYGCETWSLTLREERRSLVSENSVLRIFVPKRDEKQSSGENNIMRNLMICIPSQLLFGG